MPRTPAITNPTMREEITIKRRSVIVMSLFLVGLAGWHRDFSQPHSLPCKSPPIRS